MDWETDLATWTADIKSRGGYVVWIKNALGEDVRAAHFTMPGQTPPVRYEAPPLSVQMHDGLVEASDFWDQYVGGTVAAVVESVVSPLVDDVQNAAKKVLVPALVVGGVLLYLSRR